MQIAPRLDISVHTTGGGVGGGGVLLTRNSCILVFWSSRQFLLGASRTESTTSNGSAMGDLQYMLGVDMHSADGNDGGSSGGGDGSAAAVRERSSPLKPQPSPLATEASPAVGNALSSHPSGWHDGRSRGGGGGGGGSGGVGYDDDDAGEGALVARTENYTEGAAGSTNNNSTPFSPNSSLVTSPRSSLKLSSMVRCCAVLHCTIAVLHRWCLYAPATCC